MNLHSEPTPDIPFGQLFPAPVLPPEHPTENLIPASDRTASVLEFQAIDAVPEPEFVEVKPEADPEPPAPDRAEELRVLIDAARADAAAETRRSMEAYVEARISAERQHILEVCERFARDRQRYFAITEEQVVRLALAIAARILHREAQADPLLLAGTVRAALARIQEGSGSVLRVPPGEVSLWLSVFPPVSEPLVQVSGDVRLKPGECALETVVGRVDLGIEVQLAEISRGFSELASPTGSTSNQAPSIKGGKP